MKRNWKKEYEDLNERYINYRNEHWNCWRRGTKFFAVFLTILLTSMILICILSVFVGVFDNPIEKLGLEDKLVRIHTLKYYPEFENCNIQYKHCPLFESSDCEKSIEIYCPGLDDRDGLRVEKDIIPTKVLYFDSITLEDILFELIDKDLEK